MFTSCVFQDSKCSVNWSCQRTTHNLMNVHVTKGCTRFFDKTFMSLILHNAIYRAIYTAARFVVAKHAHTHRQIPFLFLSFYKRKLSNFALHCLYRCHLVGKCYVILIIQLQDSHRWHFRLKIMVKMSLVKSYCHYIRGIKKTVLFWIVFVKQTLIFIYSNVSVVNNGSCIISLST